ncbi:MAG: FIVAR domain-containing protein, partial [Bifidobacteriaceae bacterium]|jgi:endo-alpha-N-acetylgalactosaminidase|nr:FIVAR domain-containing protein [Bifidobacteriaceae bacterium]
VLATVIDVAKSLEGRLDGFTDDSVAALADELAKAEIALANAPTSTQAEVDAAAAALRAALDGLTVKPAVVDKAVLEEVAAGVTALSNADGLFTAVSWAALEAALADAVAVLDDASATQSEIDAAVTALTAALLALELTEAEPEPTAPEPSDTEPGPTASGASTGDDSGKLPVTGSNAFPVIGAGLALLLVGAALIATRRRARAGLEQ